MSILLDFWRFLGTVQSRTVRPLHLLLLVLVVLQIFISNFMHVPSAAEIAMHGSNQFFSFLHFGIGVFLVFLTAALVTLCFHQRGIAYYYAYCWGDFAALKRDLQTLMRFQLPATSPGGLAATVQGLGLGAMALVLASGVAWLLFWLNDAPSANDVRGWHKALTGLVEAYIIGHGLMGVLHFYLQRYRRQP